MNSWIKEFELSYFSREIGFIIEPMMKSYGFDHADTPSKCMVHYKKDNIVIEFSCWAEEAPRFYLHKKILIEENNSFSGIGFSFVISDKELEKHKVRFTNEEELKEALEYAKLEIVKYIRPLWENPEVLKQKIGELYVLIEERNIIGRNDHARSRLDKAWRDRDYQSVIDLIESINGELLKSEVMKLEYSKKHLNDQNNQQRDVKQGNRPRL